MARVLGALAVALRRAAPAGPCQVEEYSITVSNGPAERVTCVLGDLAPGLVRIFLDGTTCEGSCYEPRSH